MKDADVAILVDTATGWGRRLVRGIINYAHGHEYWHHTVEPRGQQEHARVPQGWKGAGVIARISTQRMADELASLRVPVVNVSGIELPGADFPRVTTKYGATAGLAAEHFLERGYGHFAYVGPVGFSYVHRHAQAFRDVVAASGFACDISDYQNDASSGRSGTRLEREIISWLENLPKPVGIFSWATSAGARVLHLCRKLGLSSPDEVAVLGGDDDPLLCDTTSPPMSAVLVASEQIGFRAAARLDHLMAGRRDDGIADLIDPILITTRTSTDAFAITDNELRRAMIFLRQNVFRPLTVADIADAVPMARRTLERKFHLLTRRTPLEEIRRLRLARVRELLTQTDRSIDEIADAAGFGTPEYMTAVFHKFEGITPLRYRRKVRGL